MAKLNCMRQTTAVRRLVEKEPSVKSRGWACRKELGKKWNLDLPKPSNASVLGAPDKSHSRQSRPNLERNCIGGSRYILGTVLRIKGRVAIATACAYALSNVPSSLRVDKGGGNLGQSYYSLPYNPYITPLYTRFIIRIEPHYIPY